MELALVEGELLTLKDVAVAATGLAGARRDNGIETTGLELLLDGRVDLAGGGEALSLLLLDRLGLLHLLDDLTLLLLAAAADTLAVVGLVPLTERSGINLDNGGLGQGVGADKLVVGRVVYKSNSQHSASLGAGSREQEIRTGDGNDTGLASAALGGPGKVARVKTKGTVLVVATTGADGVNALSTDLGVGRLATRLEGSLLPCNAYVRKSSCTCVV